MSMSMNQTDYKLEKTKDEEITLTVDKCMKMIGEGWYCSSVIDLCGVYELHQVESVPSQLKDAQTKQDKLLSQITKIVFKHIEVIKTGAFDNFPNLEHCILPDTLEEIESHIFRKCPKLLEKGTLKFPITNLKKMWQDPIVEQERVFMYIGEFSMNYENFNGNVKEDWLPIGPYDPTRDDDDITLEDNTLEIEHGEIKPSDYTKLVEDILLWCSIECFRGLNCFIRHYTVMMPFGKVRITKRPNWFRPKTYDVNDDVMKIYTVGYFTALPAEITVLDAREKGSGTSFTVKYHQEIGEWRSACRAEYQITGWGNSTDEKMIDIIMSQVVWPYQKKFKIRVKSIYQMIVDEDYVNYIDGNYEDEREFVDIKDFTCHKFLGMVMAGNKIKITKEFYIETELYD